MPLVSILVPIYNVERYIERCARSVFEQTYENLEFVFADDCSPDRSVEILQRVVADYPHRAAKVRILHHEHNRGLAAARNTLVDACSTEFLFHLDSDDWIEPNAIELLVKNQLETNADIVTGQALSYKDGIEEPYKNRVISDRYEILPSVFKLELSYSVWGRLIRTCLYKDNKLKCIDGINNCEDYQIVPKLFYLAKTVSGISDYVYHYNRGNDNSYSSKAKHNLELSRQSLASYKEIETFFADKEDNLRILSRKAYIRACYTHLWVHVQNRNKQGYDMCKNYLMDYYSTLLSDIRWDKTLVRLIESNYYLMLLTLPLRRARARMAQILPIS